MDMTVSFSDDELKMLKWLFDDGFSEARRINDHIGLDAMSALEPRIQALQPDLPTAFDSGEILIIAKAVAFGRNKKRSVIDSGQMTREKAAIDRVVAILATDHT